MRKIVAALQTSVDGFIEGPNGELDGALVEDEDTWRNVFEMLSHVQLLVNPIVLGAGKALFKDVKERQALKLLWAKPLNSGKVSLTYSTHSGTPLRNSAS
jgi:hypothetical protein